MKITKTKSGKWSTLIHIRDSDGTRHAKRFTCKTKDEVRRVANEYLTNHTVYIESMAFGDSMERYISASERSLSPSTIRGYKNIQKVMKTAYSGFCGISCDRITSKDVQGVIDNLKADGHSAKTIRNYIGLISAVIVSEGFRMPHYTAPVVTVPRFNVPDEDVIGKMSAACTGRYERMAVPLALACFGLRRGEICGITGDSVEGNLLYVKAVSVRDSEGINIIKDMPKTETSIRTIRIPDDIAEAIRKQGCAWKGSPESLTHSWPHLCKAAGVEPFRLHDCRHFFVSYCHDVLKLSDSEIMKLGGWKTDNVMKRRYRHSITDHSTEVVEGIGSLFGSFGATNA